MIQSQLEEIGITAKIETMEYSTMAGGEDYDLCIDYFNSTTGDASHTLTAISNMTYKIRPSKN